MPENTSPVAMVRCVKKGSVSRPFLASMLAGAVFLAGGYAVLSKSRSGTASSEAQSAAFRPETGAVTDSAPAAQVVTKTVAAKTTTRPDLTKPATPKSSTKVAAANSYKAAAGTAPSANVSGAKPASKGTKASAPVSAKRATQAKKAPVRASVTAAKPRLAQAPALPPAAAATVGEWPEYRGRLRDGVSRETGWLNSNEAQTVWQANVGTGFSSIAISQGRAYTMGNNGGEDTVWCFDAANGKVLWKYSYPCDLFANMHEGGPSATPTVDGNLVFTYSKRGHLHALDSQSGKVLWSKNIPEEYRGKIPTWGITSSPVVHGDKLFVVVGAPGANVIAFDKTNGNVAWKAGKDDPSYAAPLIFRWQNVPYLAVFNASGVVFHHLADGKELWRYPWKTAHDVNAAMPVIQGDRVFISSGYNTGAAMLQSSKDNALLWKTGDMKNHFNSSVLWNGYLYGFDESELVCLDWNTGRKMWNQGRLGKGSLIVSDGKLIILSERGELVIAEASPEGYKEISRNQILSGKCWTMPALANGRIYARNAAGNLVCVKF